MFSFWQSFILKNSKLLSLFDYFNVNKKYLTSTQVSNFLSKNEQTFASNCGSKSFEVNINQIAANKPIEDVISNTRFNINGAFSLFGIYDGHGGNYCAQSLSQRLFDYIYISLLDEQQLTEKLQILDKTLSQKEIHYKNVLNAIFDNRVDNILPNSNQYYRLSSTHLYSIRNYIKTRLKEQVKKFDLDNISKSISEAFCTLDNDMGSEMKTDITNLKVSLSGSCANVACLFNDNKETHLFISNCGDCRAMMGSRQSDQLLISPLSVDQNASNATEVERIMSQHPKSESKYIILQERLLGTLIPLRCFGDFMLKLSRENFNIVLNLMMKNKKIDKFNVDDIVPIQSKTPPYLTAKPEIVHKKITKHDCFLIIASDGIWETMRTENIMHLVNGHIMSKEIPDSFQPDDETLSVIHQRLSQRNKLETSYENDNYCTNVIRHCLGYNHGAISDILSKPYRRNYMDDMSVVIIKF
ncbi:hypothetical protein A3Q56_01148 [Intoshia linei]|uniref:PPM-type phosphatase domain-containing protein n=1 Tax=Intoshia linei TaxID=1819745 RepID=A0A177BBU4_9BILA|nr:hypothetical protein A3Q56_01148 [Intoshia linei]